MSRILFVYPNKEGYPIIPLGISTLAGILKKEKHKVDLFDVTFKVPSRLDHIAREKTGVVKKVNFEKYWDKGYDADIKKEFEDKILAFKPDLIAVSVVENNYICARELFKIAKKISSAPIIVGGIFPTVAPRFFLEDENVDIICRGEGEYPLLEIANRLCQKNNIFDIPNLIIKTDKQIIKNSFTKYYNWEPLTYQNWEIFDDRHLFKPFMGKMWRTGFFEMSRGCPFKCSYCANHSYQKIFKSIGKYRRERPLDYVIKEIAYMKKKYLLELVFFNDENFLMMEKKRFINFCLKYKRRIDLPFFIQTSAGTLLDEEKIAMLKEAGCITVGIGVETGNERIRRNILKKQSSDYVYKKAFNNCKKHRIRTTAYIMIGLPFETEKDILTTADFCKRLKAESIAISIFAPYHGTDLRTLCINNNFIEDRYDENISMNYSTILTMPQLSKNRLEELYYNFNSLVFG